MKTGWKTSAMLACFLAIGAMSVYTACIQDPVDDDYFLDIDRVKGGLKPEPAPVINSVTQSGDDINIDFSGTTTTDPDTGSDENLTYLFYWSSGNPVEFSEESLYYDERYFLGYVEHADLGGVKIVSVDPGGYTGRIYFWMTAYDGGRESDHSNVISIDI